MRLAAAFLLVLVSLPTPAAAQARNVVLAPLEGRGGAPARRAIQRALQRHGYTVTLGGTNPGDDPSAVAQLAESAGADAVVGGSASGRGDRWRVQLWVRDRSGGDQATVSMRVTGARGIRRLTDRIHEALELVPTASSATAPPSGGAPTPVPAVGSTGERPSETSAPTHATQQRPRSSDEPFPIRAFVLVGAGVRSRSVEILSPDGVDAAYRVEPFFEITARAQATFFDIGFVRARFGSSLGLESDREDPSLGTVETFFVWLRGDIGAQVVVDETVVLAAVVGLGWDRYELAFNELVPTAEYVHVRPGILGGFRLVGRSLVLDMELGLRFPFGVGDLQSLHGVEHDVIGADGLVRLHGVIEPGFMWAIEGGARQYWLTFTRPGGDVTGFDGGWHATGYAGWEI